MVLLQVLVQLPQLSPYVPFVAMQRTVKRTLGSAGFEGEDAWINDLWQLALHKRGVGRMGTMLHYMHDRKVGGPWLLIVTTLHCVWAAISPHPDFTACRSIGIDG